MTIWCHICLALSTAFTRCTIALGRDTGSAAPLTVVAPPDGVVRHQPKRKKKPRTIGRGCGFQKVKALMPSRSKPRPLVGHELVGLLVALRYDCREGLVVQLRVRHQSAQCQNLLPRFIGSVLDDALDTPRQVVVF